jgi:hypothetical protein
MRISKLEKRIREIEKKLSFADKKMEGLVELEIALQGVLEKSKRKEQKQSVTRRHSGPVPRIPVEVLKKDIADIRLQQAYTTAEIATLQQIYGKLLEEKYGSKDAQRHNQSESRLEAKTRHKNLKKTLRQIAKEIVIPAAKRNEYKSLRAAAIDVSKKYLYYGRRINWRSLYQRAKEVLDEDFDNPEEAGESREQAQRSSF